MRSISNGNHRREQRRKITFTRNRSQHRARNRRRLHLRRLHKRRMHLPHRSAAILPMATRRHASHTLAALHHLRRRNRRRTIHGISGQGDRQRRQQKYLPNPHPTPTVIPFPPQIKSRSDPKSLRRAQRVLGAHCGPSGCAAIPLLSGTSANSRPGPVSGLNVAPAEDPERSVGVLQPGSLCP